MEFNFKLSIAPQVFNILDNTILPETYKNLLDIMNHEIIDNRNKLFVYAERRNSVDEEFNKLYSDVISTYKDSLYSGPNLSLTSELNTYIKKRESENLIIGRIKEFTPDKVIVDITDKDIINYITKKGFNISGTRNTVNNYVLEIDGPVHTVDVFLKEIHHIQFFKYIYGLHIINKSNHRTDDNLAELARKVNK